MIRARSYLTNVLETDLTQDQLFSVGSVNEIHQEDDVLFSAKLLRKKPLGGLLYFEESPEETERVLYFRLRFYNRGIARLLISSSPQTFVDKSPMLEWDPSIRALPASLAEQADGWQVGSQGGAFLTLGKGKFSIDFSPDGWTAVNFQNEDRFVPNLQDALPAILLQRADGSQQIGFALHIPPGERFCGTGERFERANLFGEQIDLVNLDAAGVNNPRSYKNIPFLLSSRGYGLFVHSPAKMRLDIGAHSTRSLQWFVEDDTLDAFIIGGGSPGAVLENYRRLTGFPQMPPIWSFGVWMSRASYYSDAEVSEVARRMRAEGYPADVLHLDVGWFRKEWMCDWRFSPENFPDPPDFFLRMADMGFHVSLWQYPYVRPEIDLTPQALEAGYVGEETSSSHRHWLGYTLDFTRPDAARWYQSLLTHLFDLGASAIKADFGEEVDEGAVYQGLPGSKYHNLFALLYQRLVWEATEQALGKGNAVIWARAGWTGSQRYPVHWAGDAACTFDALAGTIRGGLHFGLSGFAFWSHDVGGIHGIPEFMLTRPSDAVYVRWTQVGVLSSHIRYHGGTPREPWEYPAISGIVRQWLRFRYALLPYLLEQSKQCCKNGLPIFRSLIFDWSQDPAVWSLDDEYLFGDSFLVCPVLNDVGVRNVYLPEGQWIDFWSGEAFSGPTHLKQVSSPLARLPLFVRHGSQITFAEPVEHTGHIQEAQRVTIKFDDSYHGLETSALGKWILL